MIPQALLAMYGTVSPYPTVIVDPDSNSVKSGSVTSTLSSFVIGSVAMSGTDNALVMALSVESQSANARTVSSITGVATSWSLVQRKSFNFTIGGTDYTHTLEVWIGKKATAAAANNVTVNMSGPINEHVVYSIRGFNNVDQTSPLEAASLVSKTNSTLTGDTASLNVTSAYVSGAIISAVQTPGEFIPNIATSGFTSQNASGSKVIGSNVGLAWKIIGNADVSASPVSWGTNKDLYNMEAFFLRGSGQPNQPTTRPVFQSGTYNFAGNVFSAIYANNVTTGHYMIAAISAAKSPGGTMRNITSVTDDKGNTWTRLATANINNAASCSKFELWGARMTAAASQPTVTAVWDSDDWTGKVIELTSFANVDSTSPTVSLVNETNGTTSNVAMSGVITSQLNNCLAVGWTAASTSVAFVPSAGWTVFGQVQSGFPTRQANGYRSIDKNGSIAMADWGSISRWISFEMVLRGT